MSGHISYTLSAREGLGLFVKASEQSVVVDDVPEASLDKLEAHVLTTERLAQEGLLGVKPEAP